MSQYICTDPRHAVRAQRAGRARAGLAAAGMRGSDPDLVDAVLEEAAKFAEGVLSPLNVPGDRKAPAGTTSGSRCRRASRRLISSSWRTAGRRWPAEPEFGGQGLPKVVNACVTEMWKSANHAFSLCPLLTTGAIEALVLAGSDELKATYLERWSPACGPAR